MSLPVVSPSLLVLSIALELPLGLSLEWISTPGGPQNLPGPPSRGHPSPWVSSSSFHTFPASLHTGAVFAMAEEWGAEGSVGGQWISID